MSEKYKIDTGVPDSLDEKVKLFADSLEPLNAKVKLHASSFDSIAREYSSIWSGVSPATEFSKTIKSIFAEQTDYASIFRAAKQFSEIIRDSIPADSIKIQSQALSEVFKTYSPLSSAALPASVFVEGLKSLPSFEPVISASKIMVDSVPDCSIKLAEGCAIPPNVLASIADAFQPINANPVSQGVISDHAIVLPTFTDEDREFYEGQREDTPESCSEPDKDQLIDIPDEFYDSVSPIIGCIDPAENTELSDSINQIKERPKKLSVSEYLTILSIILTIIIFACDIYSSAQTTKLVEQQISIAQEQLEQGERIVELLDQDIALRTQDVELSQDRNDLLQNLIDQNHPSDDTVNAPVEHDDTPAEKDGLNKESAAQKQ